MRSLPILRACVRTCRYRLSRAATPTVSLSPTTGACVVACDIPAIVPARFTPCAGSSWGLGLCAQFATERLLRNVVDERLGAVDLHGGKQLTVPLLELGVAGDVHLAELEGELRSKALQCGASTLAQVTARRVVEGDLGIEAARGGRLGHAPDGEPVRREPHRRLLALPGRPGFVERA